MERNKKGQFNKGHKIKGGSNNIENIQPLCSYCNSKKGINIIKY